jgi:hypothetical protein
MDGEDITVFSLTIELPLVTVDLFRSVLQKVLQVVVMLISVVLGHDVVYPNGFELLFVVAEYVGCLVVYHRYFA